MRVLHIWNTAGVASIIAKWQKKILGWETQVVMYKPYDPYGFTTYGIVYGGNTPKLNEKIFFFLKTILESKEYDIIHIHYHDIFLPFIRKLNPEKTIIMHYHGSDIRLKWEKRKKIWSNADIVLYSTPDLSPNPILKKLYKQVIYYLPNPVDTEIFKPYPITKKKGNALYFYEKGHPALEKDLEWAKKIAAEYGLKLDIYDRKKNQVPYLKLPYFLSRYEYYIDRRSIKSLSKTALEALACGLKVIRWDEKVIVGLPREHTPSYSVILLKKIIEDSLVHGNF